jgi:hypothetical protein
MRLWLAGDQGHHNRSRLVLKTVSDTAIVKKRLQSVSHLNIKIRSLK